MYYYDKVGNLTNITYPISPAITLRYDNMNRLTNMVDGVGTTVYGYDAVGQLLSEDGPWTDDTVSYWYDKRLRTAVNVAAPNASAWAQTYGYDSARRMTNITSLAGVFRYIYSPARHFLPQDIVFPNAVSNRFSYDSVARVSDTRMQTDSRLFCNETYVYNVGGQRTTVERDGEDTSVDYTYDKIGQLIKASGTDWTLAQPRRHEQFGYGYDAAGNLHLRTNNALVQTFNVNGLNELTNASRTGTYTVAGTTTSEATDVTVNSSAATLYTDYTFASTNHTLANGNNTFTAVANDAYGRTSTDAVTAYLPATNSFAYDANGNLTSDGQRTFAYDDENQLITVWVTNAWRSDFVYDGKLRRRARFESKWVGGAWVTNTVVRYVYDGNLVVQERDANNLPSVTYTRGKDLSGSLEGAGGIGGLLARTDNSAALGVPSATSPHAYYHADANGNVTCLVDFRQIVVAKYLYDPFGSILSQSGTLAEANLYRFSSKELHVKSGLVYYLYRYYEPTLQRWLNRDPMEELGGINLYSYVGNNPVNAIDPLGLTCKSNWDFFWDWALGRGSNNRSYGDGSTESNEMKNSPGGQAMRDKFYKGGCKNFNNGNYGTGQAAWDTLINPFTADPCGTGAQVGGFGGATATDNGNGTVTFCIPNVAGTHSFFYHVVPDRKGTTGPGRNIKQTICWTEPIDKSKCCSK